MSIQIDRSNTLVLIDPAELKIGKESPLTNRLWKIVKGSLAVLAVLMTLVIIWGIFDVIYVLYQRLTTPPLYLLNINDILATFGAFMAVLIAIEIFANIIIYLQSETIHLKLVMSTALMAAARKVIVMDFSVTTYLEIISLGVVILALSIGYWLICTDGSQGKLKEQCSDAENEQ